jgi:dihydroflavonol-4-reductase
MIAVTGASGLVGGNLVRALHAHGRSVRALVHRDKRALRGLDVDTVPADLNDLDSLKMAFEGAKIVFHLASAISIQMEGWEHLEQVNVHGTRNVIDACLVCGVKKLVYFSSIHAYEQEPLDQPLDETRPLVSSQGIPPYERSKAAAELLVRQASDRGLDTKIIIPTAIIGPYDFRPSYIGHAIQLLTKGRIPALVGGGYDWVDVRDVVDGAIQAANVGKPGSRFILSGHWRSLREVSMMVSRFSGNTSPKIIVPIKLAEVFQPVMAGLAQINGSEPLYTRSMLIAMRSNKQIRHAQAAKDLGYSPRPFEETIQDTIQWFREQGGKQ